MPPNTTFTAPNYSEGVKEVVWSGGKLPDDYYDEFVISTFLTSALKPDTMLYFPVVQECEQGVSRWIDIPKAAIPPTCTKQVAGARRQTDAETLTGPDDASCRGAGDLLSVLLLRHRGFGACLAGFDRARRRQRVGASAEDGAVALQ